MHEASPKPKVDRSRKRARGSASHVVSWPLSLAPGQEANLLTRFHAGTRLHNYLLREGLRLSAAVKADPAYEAARSMPKGAKVSGRWDAAHKARVAAFAAVTAAHGFAKATLDVLGRDGRNHASGFASVLGAHEAQVIASQVWAKVEAYHYGKRGRPRFKSTLATGHGLHSLSGKEPDSTIRAHRNTEGLVDGVQLGDPRRGGLVLAFAALPTGGGRRRREAVERMEHLQSSCGEGLLYAKLVRSRVRGKWVFTAQFTVDGHPLVRTPRATTGRACVDFGPSQAAVTIMDEAGSWSTQTVALAPGVPDLDAQIRRLQRRLDRQHRAGSPACFNADGTHKKRRCSWRKSRRARATVDALADAHRRCAAERRTSHGAFANTLLARARDISLEQVSYLGWAKSFPHSARRRGVGSCVSGVRDKAGSAGHPILEFSTYSTALSQTCLCGVKKKKPLSMRTHQCAECGLVMDRDQLSAYLGLFVTRSVNTTTGEIRDDVDLESARACYLNQVAAERFPRADAPAGRDPHRRRKHRVRPSRRSAVRIRARQAQARQRCSTEKSPSTTPTPITTW